MRAIGLPLAPTFTPSHPGTTMESYREFLRTLVALEFSTQIAPIQLAIRQAGQGPHARRFPGSRGADARHRAAAGPHLHPLPPRDDDGELSRVSADAGCSGVQHADRAHPTSDPAADSGGLAAAGAAGDSPDGGIV